MSGFFKDCRRFPLIWVLTVLSFCLLGLPACTQKDKEAAQLEPPIADKIPKQLTMHNHTRVDEYFWLNQRKTPK